VSNWTKEHFALAVIGIAALTALGALAVETDGFQDAEKSIGESLAGGILIAVIALLLVLL
jgi:hypothetical protein